MHTRKEAKKQHAHGWKVKANGGPHSAGDGAYVSVGTPVPFCRG